MATPTTILSDGQLVPFMLPLSMLSWCLRLFSLNARTCVLIASWVVFTAVPHSLDFLQQNLEYHALTSSSIRQ